eukprot:TRINITY_DN16304_c0_g1_i1.p1 TRINITY_DN16304_c0_g1~~TRINITY_DN16304_c0_g1_i1.p1  ORF type:complete len:352 (+),score=84.49 TRINITY_DN16304_c0_g1_i1:86-1141(+)
MESTSSTSSSGAQSSSSDSETSSKPTSPKDQGGPHKRKRRNWTDDELARLRSAIQIYGNNLELIRKNFNLEERQPRVLRRKIHELQAKMKQEKKGFIPKLTEDEDTDEPRYDYEMQLTFEANSTRTQPFAPWMIVDKGVLNLVWQELPQRFYTVSFAISSECIYMTAEVAAPTAAQLAFLNLTEPPALQKTTFVGKYSFPSEITVWPNTLSVSHHAGLFVVRATINNPQKRFELGVPVEPMMDIPLDGSTSSLHMSTDAGSNVPTTSPTTMIPHLSALGSAAAAASPASSTTTTSSAFGSQTSSFSSYASSPSPIPASQSAKAVPMITTPSASPKSTILHTSSSSSTTEPK